MEVEDFLIENSTIEDAKKVMQKMFDNITPEQFEELKKQALENVKRNNMSAKEMFEELGYEQQISEYAITYQNKDAVKYEISFNLEHKCIELEPTIDGKIHYFTRLDMKLLQAINKQVEELGWNK